MRDAQVTDDDAQGATAGLPALGRRGLGWLYLLGGGIGFIASFALMLEELAKLSNPNYVPSCTLNTTISCGTVMVSPQATVFGFPNPLIGIVAFAVVVTAGVALLSGFRPPRWIWLGMQIGTLFGVGFVHWLIYSTLYEIGALCPYCVVVWIVTIPLFWYTTLHNLTRGHLSVGGRPVAVDFARFHGLLLAVWYLAIAALVLDEFWYYWSTLF